MAAGYTVEYRPAVEKEDIPAIPRNLLARIFRAVESRLMTEPTRYGQRLRRSLSGLWKLRVGDYRVAYELREHRVIVWAICHRRKIYDEAERRWLH